jgi:hypothetical protein
MVNTQYRLTGTVEVPRKYADVISRRIRPLMHISALQTKTLERIMAEAYRLGVADAVDVMTQTDTQR